MRRRALIAAATLIAVLAATPAAAELIVGYHSEGDGFTLVSREGGRTGRPSEAAIAGTISADGRFAAFIGHGIALRDLRAGRTRQIGQGSEPVLAAGGGFIAYTANRQVLVENLRTGAKAIASLERRQPVAGSGLSTDPSISADGHFVAFASSSPGLFDEGGNHRYSPYQLYLRDLKTRTTTLVSRASGAHGAIGNAESRDPAISADGRFLAFTSEAANLIPGTVLHSTDVYVRNLVSGRLRRVSVWPGGPRATRADAFEPALSADGRYVAFNLQPFGGPASVVVRDLRTGRTTNASSLTDQPLKPAFGPPALSSDGRFVAFRGKPTVAGLERLYLVDLRTRRTRLVHTVSTNEGGPLSFSAKGRFLLFDTFVAETLPKGPTPASPAAGEVYRYINPLSP